MAGAGWRDFVAGEVLTAANVQDYLQDQSVMTFASSAARGSAIASPTEGMVTYLQDTDRIEIYNGTVWKFETNSIVQIVSSTVSTLQSVASSTPTSVMSVNITPKSTSNSILLLASINLGHTATNVDQAAFARLDRDSTPIYYGDASGSRTRAAMQSMYNTSGDSSATTAFQGGLTVIDSPATVSTINYNVKIWASAGTARLNRVGDATDTGSRGSLISSIIAIEIAG